MKILLTLVATIALSSAASVDNNHYSQHQSSVDSARNTMQERLSKLGQTQQRHYSSSGTENYVVPGCSTCVGSSSAYSSRSSQNSRSSSTSGGAVAADYVGVGIVGHSSAHDSEADVQSRLSSRYSSQAYEQDDLQQRVVPADLSAVRASEYRAEEAEHDEDDVQRTVGVGFHDGVVNNDRYSYAQRRQQEEIESRTSSSGGTRVLPVYYVPGGSVSSSSSHRQSAGSEQAEYQESRTNRPGSRYVSMAVRPGTAAVVAVPVRVSYAPTLVDQTRYSAGGRADYQSEADSTLTRVQPGYSVAQYPTSTYTSISSADRQSASDARISTVQQPEKYVSPDLTNYNSYNRLDSASQSRYENEDSQVQERVSPTIDSSASSTRFGAASASQRGYTGTRVIPAFPVHTIESTSSQRTAEEREQRRYGAARPAYVSTAQRTSANVESEENTRSQYATAVRPSYSSSSSALGSESASQYGSSSGGSTHYVVPVSTRVQSQSQRQGSSAQSQYQAGAGAGYMRTSYGGYPRPAYPASSQFGAASSSAAGVANSAHLSTRFGSGVASANSDDLMQYMSESERLARIQQQQIAASARGSQAVSSVDEANRRTVNSAQHLDAAAASFVGSSNLRNRLNSELDTVETIPTGGYQRVKSWQKQSKWASGSEYDDSGKIKSHSMLSTAESEKHNVNGEEAGYKAATTTLENDGKVSTYSIHTP